MPELPEVETLKLELNRVLPGLQIAGVDVRTLKIFHGRKKKIVGCHVAGVERIGKMICIKLKSPHFAPSTSLRASQGRQNSKLEILIHLKMTGRLIFDKKEYEKDKHTHVVIKFSNGKKLYFWDMRKFGWIKVIENLKLKIENLKIGIDPLTKEFSLKRFKSILEKSKKPVKTLLMEQERIAGVGNIYANEVLFCAKIHPQRQASSLNAKEAGRVHGCLQKVLQKGLKYKGASENSFRLIDGSKGRMQEHFWVYQRHGKPCPKCGQKIKRIKLAGRGTFYCGGCQK